MSDIHDCLILSFPSCQDGMLSEVYNPVFLRTVLDDFWKKLSPIEF